MKTLYFDCFAGASGNMILGGLVSLGVDAKQLISEIAKLRISDFDIEFKDVNRAGINSVHAKTIYNEEKVHRHLSDIEQIINDSSLNDSVKRRSIEIFGNLAKAEAKVHGIELEKVHFHEVGAMDAIIDVVGACIGFELLGIEKFVCSKIHLGSGFVDIAHGKYPIPPPAVAELLTGIPSYSSEIEGELITPTGAAIISTLCDEYSDVTEFESSKIGYGAGTREYDRFPNTLRLIVGNRNHELRTIKSERLLLIETNLDDISPEILGYVMEKAFEMEALDCWFTPIQMKKNRPGTMLSVLCEPSDKEKFVDLLYNETTTLGIRTREIERECLDREMRKFETEFGEVNVKIARNGKRIVNLKPEYEEVREFAKKSEMSFGDVHKKIAGEVKRKIEEE